MTLDDTTLARALHDLAATAPDDPGRLAHVHHLARRRHRRQRAIGAGALAATMAAAVVGAEALASGGRGPATGTSPAAGGLVTTMPAPVREAATLPACPVAPPVQPTDKSQGPPTVGQEFTGGGLVSGPGTATSVSLAVQGGPLAGSDLTLTIGPSSQVFVNDQATTGDHLAKGLVAKFTATRTGASTYLVDDLHAGTPAPQGTPAPGAGTRPEDKQGAAGSPASTPVGGGFKVVGLATASTATTLTVDVQGGSLATGPVTFTLECSPGVPLVGRMVSVAGTRTATSTYVASLVALEGS